MSTTPTDWVAEATSLLSAASGPAGAVTATANLLTEGLKLVEPILADDETQQYEAAKKARIQEALDILSDQAGPDRQQRLADYFSQLLLAAGCPVVGGVGNVPLVGVRVEFLLAAATGLAGKICDDQYLTGLVRNAVRQQPTAAAVQK